MNTEKDLRVKEVLISLDKIGRIVFFPMHAQSYDFGKALLVHGLALNLAAYDAAFFIVSSRHIGQMVDNPMFWMVGVPLAVAAGGAVIAEVGLHRKFYNRFYKNFFDIKK